MRTFAALVIGALASLVSCSATGANFWLSAVDPLVAGQLTNGSTPPATAAGIPQVAHGSADAGGSLYVWARPDAGKTLEAWSLRVLADNASVMRLANSAVAPFNATIGTTVGANPRQLRRWDDVGEPVGQPAATTDNKHLLYTMSGVRLGLGDLPGFSYRGVGLGALGAGGAYPDPFYHAATNAWLLARIDYSLLGTAGASNVYLQVGQYGMYHVGEDGNQFSSTFGAISDPSLIGASGRMTNSLTPEAVITVSEQPEEPSADFNGDSLIDGADFLSWQRNLAVHGGGGGLTAWEQAMAAANPIVSADFDGDGDRDGADLLTWQRGVAIISNATPAQGDSNSDGKVDAGDLAVWRGTFGVGETVASALIPEPSTLWLTILAAGIWCVVERQRLRFPNPSRAGALIKILALAVLLIVLGLSSPMAHAALLAQWTFESSQPTSAGPHAADNGQFAGAASQASGYHASPTAAYTAAFGNGSPRSFNSNEWAIGDYYQFQSSTAGFDSITLSWDQTRSTTGPADFTLQYSLTGVGAFTDLFDYTVPLVGWSSGTYSPVSTKTFNASAMSGLNDADTVYFRLKSRVAGSSLPNTSRVDNFTVNGLDLVGQLVEWNQPAGGAFSTAANWTTGFSPRIQDRPLFNLPSAYTVAFGEDVTTAGLYIATGQVSLDLQGHSYVLSGEVDVRHEETRLHVLGNFEQHSGSFLLNYGAEFSVDGTFTKTGHDYFLVGTPNFTVGNEAASSVEAGEVFIGGTGPVTLGQMIVHGEADIRHEGTVVHLLGDYQQDGGSFLLNYDAEFSVDGTFNKTGNGRILLGTSNFAVGNPGGSSVEAGDAFIGGSGAVTLGEMIVHGEADIRHEGTVVHLLGDYQQDGGTFHINYGAELVVEESFLITGNVDLGIYSSLTTASAQIGVDGQSIIDGTLGAPDIAWVAGELQLGGDTESVNSSVRLSVENNSTLLVDSPIKVGVGAQLTGDSEVFAPEVVAERGGELAGQLTVHAKVINRGQVAPTVAGTLNVNGIYQQQADGSLQIEVDGENAAPEHGLLQVTGAASLAGRLDVPLLNEISPLIDSEIVFLQAASVSGVFDSISSPNLGESGRALKIEYGLDEVKLTFIAPFEDNQFQGTAVSSNWTDSANWSAGVPQSNHLLELENLAGAPQQVAVTQNTFVHHLSVAGGSSTLTLAVANGSSFSALTGVDIKSSGVIDLNGGRMVAETLNVQTNGLLNIHNGGRFLARRESAGSATISTSGLAGTAAVLLTGAGSEFRADGELVVGDSGHGALTLSEGAYARSGDAYVGRQPGATGAVNLTGDGTEWGVAGSLFIGGSAAEAGGSGQVALNDYARLAIANRLHLWQGGELSLPDGTGSITVGRGVPTNTPGTLQLLGGGVLSGQGQVPADLLNGGALRPGNSPGIIEIAGDYTQTADGLLEIEVGELTPGPGPVDDPNAGHDLVRVGGVVTLGGRYVFPIINGFAPDEDDAITFIETFGDGSVAAGATPREVFAPGLETANSALAIRIVATTGVGGNVKLEFVPKTEIAFDDADIQADWFSASPGSNSWDEDRNPAITDNTAVRNVLGASQELRINSNDPATGYAVANVHRLEVGELDGTSPAPITVAIESGFTLAATVGDVAIGDGGTIELNSGGTLSVASTQEVSVQAGGTLVGAGLVSGSVTVGEAAGASSAVIRLGLPDQGTASLTIGGDYQQGAGGEIEFKVASGTQHDQLVVAGTAALGGVAKVVVTDAGAVTPGTVIEAVSAGFLEQGAEFADVITVGSSTVRFVPVYETAQATTLSGTSPLMAAARLEGHPVGDLNLDGVFDPLNPAELAEDTAALAKAFVDPQGYRTAPWNPGGVPNSIMGRVNDDDFFDFGDLRSFRLMAGITPEQMTVAIRAAQAAVPEPSTWALAVVAVVAVGAGRGRNDRTLRFHRSR